MSTNVAEDRRALWVGRTAPLTHDEEHTSHLEVVSTRRQRRARPRTVYAIVAVATLLGIVIAQLLLSITISQGAYQLNTLQDSQKQLQRDYQAASEDLDRLASPQYLAASANALGMVSNSSPAYLRLSDGAILGAPEAASSAAGTVTGGQGNLVPNALLKGVPLVNQHAAVVKAPKAVNPSTTSVPATHAVAPTVPLNGALPTPVTH
jgi:hypothetical protein